METSQSEKSNTNESTKLAIAVALLRSKLLDKQQHRQPPAPAPAPSDALKWKRKAKERKQEILRLHEDLKLAEDGLQYDLFPKSASCKCYFFDNLGNLSPNESGDGSEGRFGDVLRRRFLRQVRINERRRRRTGISSQQLHISDYNSESEKEQLRASVDFLVGHCETVSPSNDSFKNWSHQAVDFILTALKNLSPVEKNIESVEGIVNSLIARLLRRMCTAPEGDGLVHTDTDAQFYVQHLVRKLGAEPYIGQRVILSVSQRISMVAESLLVMDPFDDAFPSMHSCLYMMIQLIEFLVSDSFQSWSTSEGFDLRLFEDWVASILHARKALEALESRNGLYVLYMDRVIGVFAKQVGELACLQNLKPEIVANLFT